MQSVGHTCLYVEATNQNICEIKLCVKYHNKYHIQIQSFIYLFCYIVVSIISHTKIFSTMQFTSEFMRSIHRIARQLQQRYGWQYRTCIAGAHICAKQNGARVDNVYVKIRNQLFRKVDGVLYGIPTEHTRDLLACRPARSKFALSSKRRSQMDYLQSPHGFTVRNWYQG